MVEPLKEISILDSIRSLLLYKNALIKAPLTVILSLLFITVPILNYFSTFKGSSFLRKPDTKWPLTPWPSHTEKKNYYFRFPKLGWRINES